jgi:hypothetical protein
MTLPAYTQIALSQVNTELGKSSTAQITMNDSDARSLAQIPSGQIAMSDFWGKSYGYNLYYSYYYNYGERGQWGDNYSSTQAYPGMVINGYTVYQIWSDQYLSQVYSYLTMAGNVPRYFFNNLYGYDGYAYTPSGVSGGGIFFYQAATSFTTWGWYRNGSTSGGLLFAPSNYSSGAGYQRFTYN